MGRGERPASVVGALRGHRACSAGGAARRLPGDRDGHAEPGDRQHHDEGGLVDGIDIVGPQLAVLGGAGVILLADALFPQHRRLLPYVALVALAVSALWTNS